MSKNIQLTIPTPCHENWDAMSDVQKGKFCGSCQKQVVDFTNMNDRQLAEFFKKPSTGSVCGRFMTDQLEREIEIPRKRIPWLKYFFTMALPAFFISKAAAQKPKLMGVIAKPRINDTTKTVTVPIKRMLGEVAPLEIKTVVKGDTVVLEDVVVSTTNTLRMGKILNNNSLQVCEKVPTPTIRRIIKVIKGRVVDEKGNGVSFATVETSKIGKRVVANEEGWFEINKTWINKDNLLYISAVDFETASHSIGGSTYPTGEEYVKMKIRKDNILEELILSSTCKTTERKLIMGAMVATRIEKIETKKPHQNSISIEKEIIIYPNPVESGGNINIQLQQKEEGYYTVQLVTQSGQQVHQQQIWIDANAKVLNLDIPTIAGGSYFLALINKKTGKKITDKVVVQ